MCYVSNAQAFKIIIFFQTDQISVEGLADVEVALKGHGHHTVNASWEKRIYLCFVKTFDDELQYLKWYG